jgi:hypothetical protein
MAGNAAWWVTRIQRFPLETPQWMLTTKLPIVIFWVAIGSAVVSIPTTFIGYGLLWSLATVGELILGVFLVGLLPLSLRAMLSIVTIPMCILLMGALWNVWYL